MQTSTAVRLADEPALSDHLETFPTAHEVECKASAASENKLELCECMLDIASAMFNVSGRELRSPRLSTLEVSRVRQIAMYVCHVTLGLTMTEIGAGFGRDRTTVMHACHVVEDIRDDCDFDAIVSSFERVAAAVLRYRRGGVGQ